MTGIEAARGIAACLIVAFHATAMLGDPRVMWGSFDFGHGAVEFFFVLSGYMVWSALGRLMGQPDQGPSFLWRRFIRLYPTYWATLAVLLAVELILAALGLPPAPWLSADWPGILANLVVWPEPRSAYFLETAWTLSYEVWFYLLFAVAVWHRRLGLALLVLWQGTVVLVNLWSVPQPGSFLFESVHLD